MFSKYDVYVTIQSVYCYPGTDILKNKLNIREYKVLKEAEEEITAVKLFDLLKRPIHGHFSQTHLKNIHRFIFNDLYSFAGKYRTESISKLDTMFSHPASIQAQLDKLFSKIKAEHTFCEKSEERMYDVLAYYMAELNMIHPFREGNGRTIREFVRLMAKRSGYCIVWSKMDKEKILEASVQSVDEYRVLIPVLKTCMEKRDT